MAKRNQRQKMVRYFFAVEGEGEVAFIKLINLFAGECGLHICFDVHNICGGGYEKFLSEAIVNRGRKASQHGHHKKSFLMVDSDRADRGDDSWALDRLRSECNRNNFIACLQKPNLESVLARMFLGNESKNMNASDAKRALENKWPDYDKPADFMMLQQKFQIDDLLRMATYDVELANMLQILGFTLPR